MFSFLVILTITDGFSQSQDAIISFKTEYLKNQKIEFIINGLTINPDDKKYTIKIYKKEFDTLVCRKNDKQVSLSVLKFQKNTEYVIRINPCNLYDILPIFNPKKGVVRYNHISPKNDSINAELNFYSQKIISGKKSIYYAYIPSAMCTFGKKRIALTDLETNKELSLIYFNFLHGEKLTFIYNEKKKKQKLTLDGYLKENETYPIMENIK